MSTQSDQGRGIMVRSRTMKNILLVALSVAFSVVVMEGFLIWKPEFQAVAPVPDRVFCAGPPGRMERHELFGWTEVPNSAYFEQTSEADGWAVHIYNADGFRDLYDSGDEHVIVLGDSFARGTLANNDESFSHLLDLWSPDVAFRNFGTGGYGTRNSLTVYEVMSSRIRHKLVVLAYFLGNDLRDNLGSHDQADGASSPESPDGRTWRETLKEINSTIRQGVRTYNLLYNSVRPAFGGFDLPDHRVEEGLEITNDLVVALVNQVKSNGSELLIVALPSWNQINNYGDPEEAARQRALLARIADEWKHVHLIDMWDMIARSGVDRVYGIKDKHFSRYGHYLAATAIHDWINHEWQQGPRPGRQAPPFQPPNAPVVPDCALIPKYRDVFANPVRGPAGADNGFSRGSAATANGSLSGPSVTGGAPSRSAG